MPKDYLKKIIPDPEKLKQSKALAMLGSKIYQSNLWHLSRKSVARAFLNGIFWAFIPMPFQMVVSALMAIVLRANIPLSIALVWISNPLSMPFIFYLNYKVGVFILGDNERSDFQLSVQWIWSQLGQIWQPLYLGSIVTGIVAGLIGYVFIHLLWRLHIVKRWNIRNSNK